MLSTYQLDLWLTFLYDHFEGSTLQDKCYKDCDSKQYFPLSWSGYLRLN